MPRPLIRLSEFADSRQIMLARFLDHGRSIQDAARIEAGRRRGMPLFTAAPRRDDHVVVFQLYANATRECGRSPRGYRTVRKALKHARVLLAGLDRVEVHDLRSTEYGFGWFLALDGNAVLVSSRWFDSGIEAQRSLSTAVEALRTAELADGVRFLQVRRAGPLDLLPSAVPTRFGLAS